MQAKSFHRRFPRNGVFAITNKIKGYTSHVLRREFSELRSKLTTLWTESKFISSVGSDIRGDRPLSVFIRGNIEAILNQFIA